MKVHLIKKQTLEDFAHQHSGSKTFLEDWKEKLKLAKNNYRMICKYLFGAKQVHVFVCWMGTHAEYDKICKQGSQYTINLY